MRNKKKRPCQKQPSHSKAKRRISAWARTKRLKVRKGPKTNPIWKGNTASWSHDRQTDQEGGNPLVHRKTHPQLRLEGGRNRCPITRQSRICIALHEIFEKKTRKLRGQWPQKTSLTATTPSTEDYPLGLKDCQRKLSWRRRSLRTPVEKSSSCGNIARQKTRKKTKWLCHPKKR